MYHELTALTQTRGRVREGGRTGHVEEVEFRRVDMDVAGVGQRLHRRPDGRHGTGVDLSRKPDTRPVR